MKLLNQTKFKPTMKCLFILVAIFITNYSVAADYPEKGDFQKGAQAWAENCVRCHNMRDPKDLRDDQWITTKFHMRVRAGLSGQKTRDILTFLQESNNPGKPISVSRQSSAVVTPSNLTGQEVYEQTCIACHGKNGKGTVPGASNFTVSDGVLSQNDEILLKRISEGYRSENSPMAMPAKGGNPLLTETDLRHVITYMKSQFSK